MTREQSYLAEIELPVSIDRAFAYHERPGALARLIPPWENVKLEHADGSLKVGSRVVLISKLAGVPVRWVAEHTAYDPPRLFEDVQRSGPFASWTHRHEFESIDDSCCRLRDAIVYRLPGGIVGNLAGSGMARRKIESMFAYRHRTTRDDLQLMAAGPTTSWSVAVSGSNGLVGSHLSTLFSLLGHQTRPIVRGSTARENEIAVWSDGDSFRALEGVDAVVHLAGKSIADERWSEKIKHEIRDSRVNRTVELCQKLARLERPPRVLVCASATGFYGNRGDERLDEASSSGEGFLPEVSQAWEAACQAASDAGIRVVNARFGMILTPAGGALPKMLTPAQLGGGSLGDGKQWWSWVALDDVLGAIHHAIEDDDLRGPVNVVSPQPVTNREFAKILARVIGRIALMPAPAAGLRVALGEMADALLLASARVEPERLQASGYRFRFRDLEETLQHYLGYNRLASLRAG